MKQIYGRSIGDRTLTRYLAGQHSLSPPLRPPSPPAPQRPPCSSAQRLLRADLDHYAAGGDGEGDGDGNRDGDGETSEAVQRYLTLLRKHADNPSPMTLLCHLSVAVCRPTCVAVLQMRLSASCC